MPRLERHAGAHSALRLGTNQKYPRGRVWTGTSRDLCIGQDLNISRNHISFTTKAALDKSINCFAAGGIQAGQQTDFRAATQPCSQACYCFNAAATRLERPCSHRSSSHGSSCCLIASECPCHLWGWRYNSAESSSWSICALMLSELAVLSSTQNRSYAILPIMCRLPCRASNVAAVKPRAAI